MRVLLICDDYWHPGETPIEGVTPLSGRGFDIDIITDANEFSTDILNKYPVVMLSKCDEVSNKDKASWKTNSIQQAFVDYVTSGGGLIVIHTGLVAGEETKILDKLIGSKFASHPAESMVLVQPIKPHSIVKDVEQFCEQDEQYWLDILADDIDVFMASYTEYKKEDNNDNCEASENVAPYIATAGYVRYEGKGRVCALTPGHNVQVWHNNQYQKVLENALYWCAGEYNIARDER